MCLSVNPTVHRSPNISTEPSKTDNCDESANHEVNLCSLSIFFPPEFPSWDQKIRLCVLTVHQEYVFLHYCREYVFHTV